MTSKITCCCVKKKKKNISLPFVSDCLGLLSNSLFIFIIDAYVKQYTEIKINKIFDNIIITAIQNFKFFASNFFFSAKVKSWQAFCQFIGYFWKFLFMLSVWFYVSLIELLFKKKKEWKKKIEQKLQSSES